jgi:uncharacterized protein YraI
MLVSTLAIAATALVSPALAQTAVTATVDLNVRAGPGPQYPIVGVINANSGASLMGCMEGSQWCQVAFNGTEGWAYSPYLMAEFSGAPVIIAQRTPELGVPVVTYEGTADAAITGAAGGAIAGALVAGPVGAAVGGVAGAAVGATADAIIDPPEQVRTYVTSNLGEPVYLEGEVVVGATIPEPVVLREIPDYEYRYVYVNGVPALVEPSERRIVYVVR